MAAGALVYPLAPAAAKDKAFAPELRLNAAEA